MAAPPGARHRRRRAHSSSCAATAFVPVRWTCRPQRTLAGDRSAGTLRGIVIATPWARPPAGWATSWVPSRRRPPRGRLPRHDTWGLGSQHAGRGAAGAVDRRRPGRPGRMPVRPGRLREHRQRDILASNRTGFPGRPPHRRAGDASSACWARRGPCGRAGARSKAPAFCARRPQPRNITMSTMTVAVIQTGSIPSTPPRPPGRSDLIGRQAGPRLAVFPRCWHLPEAHLRRRWAGGRGSSRQYARHAAAAVTLDGGRPIAGRRPARRSFVGVIERRRHLYRTSAHQPRDGLVGHRKPRMPPGPSAWSGDSATAPHCRSTTPASAAWGRSSAGRTTCRSCVRRCTRRASRSTARPRSTTGTRGRRRCSTSPSRAGASCWAPRRRSVRTPSARTTTPHWSRTRRAA